MPKIISKPESCFVKVRFSQAEVEAFKRSWPCAELRNRSYWFEFDKSNGDLVDHDVPHQDDGSAATALSQDAWKFYEENKP